MSLLGLKLAVRYSLPPCKLGFCGPLDKKSRQTLYNFAVGKRASEEEVRGILEKFEALYPYLELIASANGIDDPFDEQVVKAYWIGNKLLDSVSTADLRRMIQTDFVGVGRMSLEDAEERADQIPDGVLPHHSFHVLILGSITGRVKLDTRLKDLCRIGWGRVTDVRKAKVKSKNAKVRWRPLVFDGKVRLEGEVETIADWDWELVPGVKVGAWVSLHWGQMCDVLGEEDVANIAHYTGRTLRLLTTD